MLSLSTSSPPMRLVVVAFAFESNVIEAYYDNKDDLLLDSMSFLIFSDSSLKTLNLEPYIKRERT
jgi:hypothetical protein